MRCRIAGHIGAPLSEKHYPVPKYITQRRIFKGVAFIAAGIITALQQVYGNVHAIICEIMPYATGLDGLVKIEKRQ